MEDKPSRVKTDKIMEPHEAMFDKTVLTHRNISTEEQPGLQLRGNWTH